MPRVITIVIESGFTVREGARYADRLTFGEMLEQVVQLTHPAIGRERYPMLTAEEYDEQRRRRDARIAQAHVDRCGGEK